MLKRLLGLVIFLAIFPLLLGTSVTPPGDQLERVRRYTRAIEFDYVSWTLEAAWLKVGQLALGTADYLPAARTGEVVRDYLRLVDDMRSLRRQINDVYADPQVSDPGRASAELRQQYEVLRSQRRELEPLAESIVQEQVGYVAAQAGLTLGGQPVPPVLFHITPPPYGLIISPRSVIRQEQDISISPQLTTDELVALEQQVDQALDVSSLAVGIGGIGLYPTMVMEITDINRLAEVVAHEWVHNYLTLRPLGVSYLSSPELRVMNETAASIAGNELGRLVVEQFYPDLLPPPPAAAAPEQVPETQPAEPPPFDYRAEMHETRVNTDRLLAEGKVETAEWYMEMRRRYLWDNGYHIRKLNQAFFAFYGAYADQPGGAAGEDPVGAAVRALRQQSQSLAAFINRISWMWSFADLQKAVRVSGS